MTTTLLLLLSCVLIGTGVSLIWRDLHRRQRDAFVLWRDPATEAGAEPEVEITVSRRAASAPLPTAAPAETRQPAGSLGSKLQPLVSDNLDGDDALPRPDAGRPSATAQQWAGLQPVVNAAVEQVNAVLAGAGVSVGAPGEPSWGMSKAYGSHRRVLVGGESLAWLRLELTGDGRLNAAVKAHKDDLAEINAEATGPASGLSTARISDLLSECLKPAASYAMRAGGGGDSEQRASETAWSAVDAIVVAALKTSNGALAQAGARLLPLTTPAWDEELRHHRMTIAVEVFGNDIARMHIDRLAQEMEVAVGLPEAHLADLGRRRRMALEGMTTHALAELIASCAWPAIAGYRETHRPA